MDVQRLLSCDVNQRLSALGWWGCAKAPGIRDTRSFRIDDFLHDRSADARQLQSVIRAMDAALRKGSLLVFCKQGCRRGPTLVGSYLMAKTRCAPGVVSARRAGGPTGRRHTGGRCCASSRPAPGSCHRRKMVGHLKAECRQFLSGKPTAFGNVKLKGEFAESSIVRVSIDYCYMTGDVRCT